MVIVAASVERALETVAFPAEHVIAVVSVASSNQFSMAFPSQKIRMINLRVSHAEDERLASILRPQIRPIEIISCENDLVHHLRKMHRVRIRALSTLLSWSIRSRDDWFSVGFEWNCGVYDVGLVIG